MEIIDMGGLEPLGGWLGHPAVQQLGWVLVHFVWQGTVIAGMLAGALALLRIDQARLRYACSVIALGAASVAPVVTWGVLFVWQPGSGTAVGAPALSPNEAEALLALSLSAESDAGWMAAARSMLVAQFPWIVVLWGVGVSAMAIRVLGGWIVTLRLRRARSRPAPPRWQRRTRALAEQLNIAQPVRLRCAMGHAGPMVLGWLRPVVVLPAGMLTGLPPQQVEALIAHELIHIRRHDVLVGWIQAAIETLLFYHPAVWWMSNRVRAEREFCCDDRAVVLCRSRGTYARALTALAGQRAVPAGSMGATGGALLTRVRRVLHASDARASHHQRRSLAGVALVVAIGSLGIAACASQRSASSEEAASPAPVAVASDTAAAPAHRAEERVLRDSTEQMVVIPRAAAGDSLQRKAFALPFDTSRHEVVQRLFGSDTVPHPPAPAWPHPPTLDWDSLRTAWGGHIVPRIDLDSLFGGTLDSLRGPRPPVSLLQRFLMADTIDHEAFRERMDSLRVEIRRQLEGTAAVDADSLRREVERARREARRALREHRRELLEHLQREQPERLREQAEMLRRQAERLEAQARQMEQRRPPAPEDTTRGLQEE